MTKQPKEFRTTVAGRELTLTVGKLAGQADAAVTARSGDTVVLVAVLLGEPKPDKDFMPLLIEYEEKFYAAGKIKGSRFVKREGRPTDHAITTGRIIDRSIRPLFPKDLRNDIEVFVTVLSYDGENEPDVLALLATSAALSISKIPWDGPLGAARVGRVNGQWAVNPTVAETGATDLELFIAATETEAVMLEAGAREVSEDDFLAAAAEATKVAGTLARFVGKIAKEVGVPKVEGVRVVSDPDLVARIRKVTLPKIEAALRTGEMKLALEARVAEVTAAMVQEYGRTPEAALATKTICHDLHREVVREWILAKGQRVGGRALDEVRPLAIEVGVLPRTHGSGLFQRGETQVLSTVTLGSPDDVLILDTMTEADTKKRFFLMYNMPGYASGEIKPSRGPGRREIGHGALAERALLPLLPAKEQFPYTTMVVSEILSSNGSTSMGAACAASLALMDAGVPIPRHVAGIAMGLVTDETTAGRAPKLLTDIAGMEDEGCDMDFKVAGTRTGITAVQVDTKTHGISADIVREALRGARKARLHILDAMEAALPEPRPELSKYAPRIVSFSIKPEKIGDVIGPRGTIINKITEETGVDITIEDDGLVSVMGTDAAKLERAVEWVKQLVREAKPGELYTGKVTRLMNFGAFVEIFPGTDGLVHISEFGAGGFVRRIEDVAKVGDTLEVIVKEIDEKGRVNLGLQRPVTGAQGPAAGGPPPERGYRPPPSGPRRDGRGGPRPAPRRGGFGSFRRTF